MTSAAKKILDEAMALPEDERRELAEQLLRSVAHDDADAVAEAWDGEAARRADEIASGAVAPLDGAEVSRRLGAKVARG